MVMQNKALILFALKVLINSEYASNMHTNKQMVLKLKCYPIPIAS